MAINEKPMNDPYLPISLPLIEVTEEVGGPRAIKRFKMKKAFDYRPGQCGMLSSPGKGEVMIAISSSPTREVMEFGVMRTGVVTNALHELKTGDAFSLRGPLGNGFPVDEWRGKNLVLIGGGIGITPVKSIIDYALDKRSDFGKIDFVYGSRTSADLCYRKDLEELAKRKDINLHLSVDVAEEGWKDYVGFVPANLLRVAPSPENTIAVTCGPPIMIKFVVKNLVQLGFLKKNIYTTLERRMKCGVGKCGRCNIGDIYVCKDGPVFAYDILERYPDALG
jgi:sulfhydrogenase subunit gamma (sulfur reductase)